MSIPTPHIEAKDIDSAAETVIMPGDPLWAKYIEEHFLENVTQFNSVRGMYGYCRRVVLCFINILGIIICKMEPDSAPDPVSMGIFKYSSLFHFLYGCYEHQHRTLIYLQMSC